RAREDSGAASAASFANSRLEYITASSLSKMDRRYVSKIIIEGHAVCLARPAPDLGVSYSGVHPSLRSYCAGLPATAGTGSCLSQSACRRLYPQGLHGDSD